MRILLVVHGFPPEATGGTEGYTRDLAAALALAPDDEVFVLAREADPGRPENAVRRETDGVVEVFRINNTFRDCRSLEESYRNPALLAAILPVLDLARPDVVHVQHLTCLSTELPCALAQRGVPVVMTLNDYWLLCHRGQLFDRHLERCDGPGETGCAHCIPPSAGAAASTVRAARTFARLPAIGAIVRATASVADHVGSAETAEALSRLRLQHMRRAVASIDLFLAPSRTIEERFLTFGIAPRRLARCVQGIRQLPVPASVRRQGTALRVVYAGSLLPSKAPHVLLQAAATLPAGSIEVEVLGGGTAYHGDDSYARVLEPLLHQRFVRLHGTVPSANVRAVVAASDVVCVPSVWIENAPFVIKEAFACGRPVVASDLGGMAELVRHDVDGLLFTAGDPMALAVQLRRLIDEPQLVERLRDGIQVPGTIEDDAAALRGQYQEIIDRHAAAARAVRPDATPRSGVTAVVLNYRTPEQTWLAVRSLASSFVSPDAIIIVDNSGEAESLDQLIALFEMSTSERVGRAFAIESAGGVVDVRVVATVSNTGFSGGVNVGIRMALEQGAEFVLLVNSDVVLEPDTLDCLLRSAGEHPEAGILAPLIVSREEPGLVSTAGIDYSESTARVRNRMSGVPVSAVPGGALAAPAVSGCVMLIRRAVLARSGLFDEQYFFSFEDVEFCLRAKRAGFGTICVPQARAHHEGSASIGRRSSRRVYFATRNHLRLAASLEPAGYRRAVRAGFIVALNAAYVLTSPDAPLFGGLAAVARGTRDHLVGRYGADSVA